MLKILCRASGGIALGALLLLGVFATTSAQAVQDFSVIQAGPLEVVPDESGRFATLTVDTSIDVACSVVYGPDETFGLIAVDSDMDGGAHTDHHPIMGGLEPDTEYQYRVQGTAPDGAIYVSEVFDFRTPPAPVGGPTNLALNGSVSGVSSEFSDSFGATNAFDGDATTEWSSGGDGNDAWIEIDLGEPMAISDVVFRTRSMGDGSATTQTFSVTADGVELGTFAVDEPAQLDTEAQVLRFDVEASTGGNTGTVDILIFGE